jgi:O-acetyl-ADP-ribose deacetylase (regulator of RNase III)
MPYRELSGNLFASKADALVNTVNCVGPMGKGVALEFRRRFPEMFAVYKEVCERGELKPGSILPYRKSRPWVLNFAVKNDWKYPSKEIWIESCLEKFCQWYPKVGLKSVAFPWMGAMNGGIPLDRIQAITRQYLSTLTDIDVEVYTFDPKASDPLFDELQRRVRTESEEVFSKGSGIRRNQVAKLYELFGEHRTPASLADIGSSEILGKTSLDRLYNYVNVASSEDASSPPTGQQLDLFPQ